MDLTEFQELIIKECNSYKTNLSPIWAGENPENFNFPASALGTKTLGSAYRAVCGSGTVVVSCAPLT